MKKLLLALLIVPTIASASWFGFLKAPAVGGGSGTINQLQQWSSTTTPSSAITQTVWGKALKLTGLTNGSNLCLDANGIVTTTGCASGSGGGVGTSTNPFMPTYLVATSTTATSSLPVASTTKLIIGGESVTDITGSGLKIVNNALTSSSTDVFINVKDYGATGDGSTDDTSSINAALSVQQNASTTACLYFPAGKYKYTGSIEPARRLCIKGMSGAENFAMSTSTYRSEIEFQNDNQAAFVLGSTSPINTTGRTDGHSFEDIYISNLTYQDSSKTSSAAFELLDNSKSHRFYNIGISKFAYGFKAGQDEVWQNDLKNITINSFSISCIEAFGSITNITVDQFYCRNTAQGAGETAPTATVTSASKAGNIITFNVTSVPYEFQIGRYVYVQDTSLNVGVAQVVMAINATTSTTIDLIATSSDPLPGSDYVGRLTMDAKPILGPALKLGGIWTFRGLDIEHIISSSTEIIYLLGGTVSINDINFEQIYWNNSAGRLLSSATGALNVHAMQFINSGIGQGQSVTLGYNNSSSAGVRIEQALIRDINRTYATAFTPGRANTNAPDVYVGHVVTPAGNRAGANSTFTSMGQTVMPVTTRMSTTTMTGGEAYIPTSLGIGSTTPMSPLVVVGEAMAGYFTATNTAATSTFTGVRANCFSTDGTTCISGGNSFGYPFPSNATSTELTFNGGLIANLSTTTNATTTSLSSTVASTTRMYVDSSISLGTTSQSAALSIDVTGGTDAIFMGRNGAGNAFFDFSGSLTNLITSSGILNLGNSRADDVNKSLRLTFSSFNPFNNGDVCAIVGDSSDTAHGLTIGGGSTGCKAVNTIRFLGTTGTTTAEGTQIMSMSGSSGNVVIGSGSATTKLTVEGSGNFFNNVTANTFTATSTTATSTFPVASTTDLIVSSGGNAAGSFVAFDRIGRLIATSTPSGTGNPFPSNATSTELTFNGGIIVTNSTTTNATTSNLFATVASTTNLYANNISIGTTSQTAPLTIGTPSGNPFLIVQRTAGARFEMSLAGSRVNFIGNSLFNFTPSFTDATSKTSTLTFDHYNSVTEEPACLAHGQVTDISNSLIMGGGSSACNAVTTFAINTAADNTTTTGTERFRITSTGNVGIATTSPYAKLSVVGQTVSEYFTATSTTASSTLPLVIGGDISLNNIFAKTSAGLDLHSAGGIIANFGAGAGTGATFYGGVNIDGATRLATSLNGPLQANAGAVTATTSVGVLYGGLGLTTAPSFGQIPVGNNASGYTLTATTSMGLFASSSLPAVTTLPALSLPLSQTTGTLGIANGGTGQTAFGQGWLHSDSSTISASTSPTVNYIVATSTTASSTFPILESQYALFGNARPLSTDSTVKMEVWGDNNGAVQMGIGNRNSGTAAYNCLFFNNDRANSLVTDYAAACLNSGKYTDTTFGTAMASPSQWSFENTMGQTSFFYSSTTATTDATAFDFYTGGRNTENLKVRINNSGNVSIGTSTTNRAKLEVVQNASSPAIIVDGGSGGNNLFRFFRSVTNGGNGNGLTLTVTSNNPLFCYNTGASETSAGTIRNCLIYGNTSGNFFISTSTPAAGTITGLEPFMLQNSSGKVGLAGTSTPWGRVSINPTIFHTATDPIFVVGSSTKTDFIISTSGNVGIGTSTTPAENIDLTVSDRAATSTIFIRSQAATLGGRIILGDVDGVGCTEVTANNGVLSAKTVTCP